jgi:hypothetical protein
MKKGKSAELSFGIACLVISSITWWRSYTPTDELLPLGEEGMEMQEAAAQNKGVPEDPTAKVVYLFENDVGNLKQAMSDHAVPGKNDSWNYEEEALDEVLINLLVPLSLVPKILANRESTSFNFSAYRKAAQDATVGMKEETLEQIKNANCGEAYVIASHTYSPSTDILWSSTAFIYTGTEGFSYLEVDYVAGSAEYQADLDGDGLLDVAIESFPHNSIVTGIHYALFERFGQGVPVGHTREYKTPLTTVPASLEAAVEEKIQRSFNMKIERALVKLRYRDSIFDFSDFTCDIGGPRDQKSDLSTTTGGTYGWGLAYNL